MESIIAGPEYRDAPAPVGVTAATLSSDAPSLAPLAELLPSLHIYTHSSLHFAALSAAFNNAEVHQPLAVIRPTSPSEVAGVVSFCANSSIPITIRSGGNDIGGRSVAAIHGVVIDMRSMDNITISPDKKSAVVGGGVLTGRLLKFLDDNGLTTPTAFDNTVGYTGWACGGGYSVLCGSYGMGCDQIVSGKIVRADGEVVDITAEKVDNDAMWALRGGGAGILGVVAELTIKVYPNTPALAGFIGHPLSEARQIFERYQALYGEGHPDKLCTEFMVMKGMIMFLWFWRLDADISDLPEAQAHLERCSKVATVLMNTVSQTSMRKFTEAFPNPTAGEPKQFAVKSRCVAGWPPELGEILASLPPPTESSAIVVHNSHGAATSGFSAAAFRFRMPHLVLGISAFALAADKTDETRQLMKKWPAEVDDAIVKAELGMPAGYINFSAPEAGDGERFFGEKGARRMRVVKRRFDPDNVFARCTPDLYSQEE